MSPEISSPAGTAGIVTQAGHSRRVIGVAGFAILTAVAAHVAVPLPGTPVPMTLQVAGVLLAGALLGTRLGAVSQAVYLAAGIAGLPVFAAGGGAAYLLGPTGGYLLAYPAAAALAGYGWRRRGVTLRAAGLLAAVGLIHAGGAAWLSLQMGAAEALAVGVIPFLVGDLLKVALVFMIASGAGRHVQRWLG